MLAPVLTRSITVDRTEAEAIRAILATRVRLQVVERQHWLLWRRFTVTGPADAVEAAMREVDEHLDAQWWARQW